MHRLVPVCMFAVACAAHAGVQHAPIIDPGAVRHKVGPCSVSSLGLLYFTGRKAAQVTDEAISLIGREDLDALVDAELMKASDTVFHDGVNPTTTGWVLRGWPVKHLPRTCTERLMDVCANKAPHVVGVCLAKNLPQAEEPQHGDR